MSLNEIQLSTDINVITAEIQSYKQIAGQSIFEIGRRLKHVKENDLVHGEFGKWLETIDMSNQQASRFIKVFEEIPQGQISDVGKKGLNALYEIATLPEEEREKEHVTSKGETKTVDEMTNRELRELKRQLKQEKEQNELTKKQLEQAKQSEEIALRRLEEEQEKEPKTIEKEVVPDHIKKRIKELEEKAGNLEKYKTEVNGYKRQRSKIENELAELNARAREIEKSNNSLAQQASLVNAISLPVSHLEKKKAEIEQLMKREIELTNHARNTLKLKSDFLMEMAVKINRYLENKNDHVEVIDVE